MIQVRFRYVFEDRDRHGKPRVYFWKRPGPKIRIKEPIGSEAFSARYSELMSGEGLPPARRKAHEGSFLWLVEAYGRSAEAKGLDPKTQRTRQLILEHCTKEHIAPGRSETFADFPIDRMTTKALAVLRDRKAGLPEAANNRVRALRVLFKWAAKQDLVRTNVARDLERIKNRTSGHVTWTDEAIEAFERRHPIGTKARLALSIFLYTGMRRSDAVQFGRQHVRDGWISKPQWKGRRLHPQRIEIPMLQPLAEIIEASPTGDLAFLVTESGQPFSIAGFGNWFRDRCREAGLTGYSAHGLRKAGATRAAEAGATTHMLMSMFGWKSIAEAELYTRAAERKQLARDGMAFLAPKARKQESG